MKYTQEDLETITHSIIRSESFEDISNKLKHPHTSLLAKIQKIIKGNPEQFKDGRINRHIKNIMKDGWQIYYRSYLSELSLSEKQFEEIILLSHVVPREKLVDRYGINYFALVKIIQLKEAEYPSAKTLGHKRGKDLMERARGIYNQGSMNIRSAIKKEVFEGFKIKLVKEIEETALNDIDGIGYLALWYAIQNSKYTNRVKETELKNKVDEIVNKAFLDWIKTNKGYEKIKEEITKYVSSYCNSHRHFQNIKTRIENALKRLDENEQLVLNLRYGLGGYHCHSVREVSSGRYFDGPETWQGINYREK